jgi:hypothetical protein
MPKLEVRLTQAEWDHMEAARNREQLDRSAWVRLHCFHVKPEERAQRVSEETGARRRAQAARAKQLRDGMERAEPTHAEPPPPARPPERNGADPSLPSTADVALQTGLPYATAERYIGQGRVSRREDGRLLIDGNPC